MEQTCAVHQGVRARCLDSLPETQQCARQELLPGSLLQQGGGRVAPQTNTSAHGIQPPHTTRLTSNLAAAFMSACLQVLPA